MFPQGAWTALVKKKKRRKKQGVCVSRNIAFLSKVSSHYDWLVQTTFYTFPCSLEHKLSLFIDAGQNQVGWVWWCSKRCELFSKQSHRLKRVRLWMSLLIVMEVIVYYGREGVWGAGNKWIYCRCVSSIGNRKCLHHYRTSYLQECSLASFPLPFLLFPIFTRSLCARACDTEPLRIVTDKGSDSFLESPLSTLTSDWSSY